MISISLDFDIQAFSPKGVRLAFASMPLIIGSTSAQDLSPPGTPRSVRTSQEQAESIVLYEVHVIQKEMPDSAGGTFHMTQVMVGLSCSTLTSLRGHQIPTYDFWESIASLGSHFVFLNTRASQLSITDSPERGAVWSNWAANILRDSLRAARLTERYNVHQTRDSFECTVYAGLQLDSDYRCGAPDEPVCSIFIVSQDMSEVSEARPSLALAHTAFHVPPLRERSVVEILDDVVATVDRLRGDEVASTERQREGKAGNEFIRAIRLLVNSSLTPGRFTPQTWQSILHATEKNLPSATDLQAQSTKSLLEDLVYLCPSAGRVRYEVHSGESRWNLFQFVQAVVADDCGVPAMAQHPTTYNR